MPKTILIYISRVPAYDEEVSYGLEYTANTRGTCQSISTSLAQKIVIKGLVPA